MKPPPYCSSLQDGGGFLCLGCACFCAWIWDAEPDALAGVGVRSLGLLAIVEASPDNAGGGVPPLRR